MKSTGQETIEIIREIKASRKFTEGFNASQEGCKCERCQISRYRHTGQPELMDASHSYWDYLRYCMSQVTLNGLWLEFGVGEGTTADFIAANNDRHLLVGFDPFENLPEDWKMSDTLAYLKDQPRLNGTMPALKQNNIRLIRGEFRETLPDFLGRNEQPCAFVHIDCGQYEATLYILTTLHARRKLLKGSIILFDGLYNYQHFENHEFRAFQEFFRETGLAYRWLAHTVSPVVWNGNQAAIVLH